MSKRHSNAIDATVYKATRRKDSVTTDVDVRHFRSSTKALLWVAEGHGRWTLYRHLQGTKLEDVAGGKPETEKVREAGRWLRNHHGAIVEVQSFGIIREAVGTVEAWEIY